MVLNNRTNTNSPYAHSGSLTREQFLFFEMRTTAKLMIEGLTDEEIYERIYSENLFQFPTEKSIIGKASKNDLETMQPRYLLSVSGSTLNPYPPVHQPFKKKAPSEILIFESRTEHPRIFSNLKPSN